jgi:hypothetical protein
LPNKIESAAANDGNEKFVVEGVESSQPEVVDAPTRPSASETPHTVRPAAAAPAKPAPPQWHVFVRNANPQEIKERLAGEIAAYSRQAA